jgi:hypothetical protein
MEICTEANEALNESTKNWIRTVIPL